MADHLLVAFAVDVLMDYEGRSVGPDLSEMVRARLPWELCEAVLPRVWSRAFAVGVLNVFRRF